MKIKIVKNALCDLSILCFSVVLFAAPALAQSDKPIESKTVAPASETSTTPENKADLPKPKAIYEYVEPQNIRDFMLALKEAGKRGFRLDKMTAVPGSSSDYIKQKAKGTVLAGIVKFDGESRYDYNFFFAEGEDDPEQTLNRLSKEGWAFRDVITIYGGGDESSLLVEDIFANRIRKLPTIGNIYLLERVDGKKTAPDYKLLKAGHGAGKNPTPKMQGLLDGAVAEGYLPVGTYYSWDMKSLLTVDSFFGVIVEKNAEVKKPEYKFVRSNRSDGLRKEIETFSKQGFRIGVMNFNSAVLVREAGSSAPVNYEWLDTDKKTYTNDLAAALAKNPSYISGGIDMVGSGDFIRNLLIFENNAPAQTVASDYQFVKMTPKIPKQFKKNPQEYLKTIERPEVAFQKLMDEGYAPRDLYYSDTEGLTVLFARPKR